MEIDPSLINLPVTDEPVPLWVCYGDAGVLVVPCDDWGDSALIARSMQRMDAIMPSLVDRMSAREKIAFLARAAIGDMSSEFRR